MASRIRWIWYGGKTWGRRYVSSVSGTTRSVIDNITWRKDVLIAAYIKLCNNCVDDFHALSNFVYALIITKSHQVRIWVGPV